MCGGFEGFEEGFALPGGDVELAGGLFGYVGLDYVFDFLSERLDGDWIG
jgi:hypothetical protein